LNWNHFKAAKLGGFLHFTTPKNIGMDDKHERELPAEAYAIELAAMDRTIERLLAAQDTKEAACSA
jgi:hypothetical protein